MKVFVYGTLRKELGNHYLLQDSVYCGVGLTKKKFVMLESSTGHSIPFVVKPNKKTQSYATHIEGEIYEVNQSTLMRLDALEGHPKWYRREYIDVTIDRLTIKAQIYFMPWTYFEKRNTLIVNETGDFFQSPVEHRISHIVEQSV